MGERHRLAVQSRRIVDGADCRGTVPVLQLTGRSSRFAIAGGRVTLDPRTPVLVGVGQLSNRVDRGRVAARAGRPDRRAPCGAPATTPGAGATCWHGADSVRIVQMLSWRYRDPAALVAAAARRRRPATPRVSRRAATARRRWSTGPAATSQRGDVDLVLIGGAEAWRTRTRPRTAGKRPRLDRAGRRRAAPARRHRRRGRRSCHPAEMARGVVMPVQVYPLFEQALRAARGPHASTSTWSRVAELWAALQRGRRRATRTPGSSRRAPPRRSARPTPDNRMIGFPYTKLMNSNNAVEQGAGVHRCARSSGPTALGVPRDRWVFPHSGTDAHDHYFVSDRDDLHSSPAIRLAGRRAARPRRRRHRRPRPRRPLLLLPVGRADRRPPSSASASTASSPSPAGSRSPAGRGTTTSRHSIATMVDVLRARPGLARAGHRQRRLHHQARLRRLRHRAAGRSAFRHAEPQAEVDALPAADVVRGATTAPVDDRVLDRDARPRRRTPRAAIVAGLLADGRRAWGTTSEPDHAEGRLVAEEPASAARPTLTRRRHLRSRPSSAQRSAARDAARSDATVRPRRSRRAGSGPSRRTPATGRCRWRRRPSRPRPSQRAAVDDHRHAPAAEQRGHLGAVVGGRLAVAVGAGGGERARPRRPRPGRRGGRARARRPWRSGSPRCELDARRRAAATSVSGPGQHRSAIAAQRASAAASTRSSGLVDVGAQHRRAASSAAGP